MMYVKDSSVKFAGADVPEAKVLVAESGKFPCVVFGYTTVDQLNLVMKDRKGLYVQFKKHNRYYKEYMEVFKYMDKNVNNEFLTTEILLLGSYEDKKEMLDSLYSYVIKYKLCYSDKCLAREYALEIELLNIEVGFSKVVEVPKVLTSAEKRKISRKRYEDSVRDKLREKSKNYYAEHKEELSEKRRLKRQASKGITVGNNLVLKKLDSIDEWLCIIDLDVFIQSPNGDCIHDLYTRAGALVREKIFKYSSF